MISITRIDDQVISSLFRYWADLKKWIKFNHLFVLQIKMCLQQLFKIVSYEILVFLFVDICLCVLPEWPTL